MMTGTVLSGSISTNDVIIQRFSRLASRIHREVSSIPTGRSAEDLLKLKDLLLNFGLELKKLCNELMMYVCRYKPIHLIGELHTVELFVWLSLFNSEQFLRGIYQTAIIRAFMYVNAYLIHFCY